MNPNPWSYSYIRALAEEATVIARENGLEPALVSRILASWKNSRRFNIPFLGDYTPKGWQPITEIEPFFVDCTGRKRAGEPGNAITYYELSKRLEEWGRANPTWALGIIEAGQTQVLVQIYKR